MTKIWLFDVNVLIAIADQNHVFHSQVHRWLRKHPGDTWATCPLTENGFIRVLSQPGYRGGMRTPAEAIAFLLQMKQARTLKHVFWADDFSITDGACVLAERLTTPAQITDLYLAALAFRKGARLVTFDSRVAWQAVAGAGGALLEAPGA